MIIDKLLVGPYHAPHQYIARRKNDQPIQIIVGWRVINVTAADDLSRASAS